MPPNKWTRINDNVITGHMAARRNDFVMDRIQTADSFMALLDACEKDMKEFENNIRLSHSRFKTTLCNLQSCLGAYRSF